MTSPVNIAGWLVAGVLALFVVATAAGIVSGGPLDPSATPVPTLPQIEPRNPIPPVGWNGTFPILINQPGSYFLTRNLTVATATNGINVDADNVDLDLNGFVVSGQAPANGIHVVAAHKGLHIHDGVVSGWSVGIDAFNSNGGRFDDLTILHAGNTGLDAGVHAVVSDCRVRGNDFIGIRVGYGVVRNCEVFDNSCYGLAIGPETTISDSKVRSNGAGAVGCWGITMALGGGRNTIEDNDLINDSDLLLSAENNIITGNFFYNCASFLAAQATADAGDYMPFDQTSVHTNFVHGDVAPPC